MKEQVKFLRDSIAGSYSQVFFSDNQWLALLVLLASFVDPYTGISGFLCVTLAVFFAKWMGFNPELIRNGTYTYNVLLVGLAMGFYFKFNTAFFAILPLGALLTLMVSVWMSAYFARHKVPFLSLPFVVCVWIILLSSRSFETIKLSERTTATLYEWWSFGGPLPVSIYHKTANFIPHLAVIYFKSLGAIFFQYNIISGLLLAIGLLYYSRIAFSLSIIGFMSGYFFSYFIQGNMSELEYSYIGFNFILSAIALGGFFIVPSVRSYILAVISAALIVLLISGLGIVASSYLLPLYSLPFSMVVILALYVLENRYSSTRLQLVEYQKYSPEKNLYAHHNNMERFKNDTYIHIHLPFFGEWFISQGHEGEITHKDDFKYAWDFVITDENKKTYRGDGKEVEDFYCYGKPVLSPASGQVVTLEDGVDDNIVGDVNIEKNWGNTVVIKHADYLYSKLCHLKKDSFKVKNGDFVKKGDVLAVCGNSGRSPEPHVHFQLQSSAYLGAGTIKYPISYYLTKEQGKLDFSSFGYPEESSTALRPTPTPLLSRAFHFIPGMKFEFEVDRNGSKTNEHWEVFTDSDNETYIYCRDTNSIAFFKDNDVLHYFINFKGDKNSLLYYFYLGAYKVLLCYYEGVELHDALPVSGFYNGLSKTIQDFIAPLHIYLKADYSSVFSEIDDEQNPGRVKISSTASRGSGNNKKINFEIVLENNGITKFIANDGDLCITAQNIGF